MSNRVKLTDNSGEQASGDKVGTGAYIKIGTIVSVEDKSSYPGQEAKFHKSGKQTELCLVVDFKVDEFDRKLFLFGKFKRNAKGQIISWDSWNNNIQRFLYKILLDQAEIDENLQIPGDVIAKLIGKQFQYVNYQSNKTYQTDDGEKFSFQIWGKVFGVNDTKEEIIEEWNNNLQWINDYAPEIVSQRHQSANEGFNPEQFEKNTASAPDDDII